MASRITPHRPGREDAKGRELTDAKRENNQLKRTIRRLQKELRKASESAVETEEEPAPSEESAPTPQTNGIKCEACGYGAVREVELIGKVFLICPECRWRKRKE